MLKLKEIKGVEKVAIILLNLRKNQAGEVMSKLSSDEISRLSLAMCNLGEVFKQKSVDIINDFISSFKGIENVCGGRNITSDILASFMSKDEVAKIMLKISDQNNIWDAINIIEPEIIALYLREEKSEIIAIILSKINPSSVSRILCCMEQVLAEKVMNDIVVLEEVSDIVMSQIEESLRNDLINSFKSHNVFTSDMKNNMLAKVLNGMNKVNRDKYLTILSNKHPEIDQKVRELMFTFDDIVNLSPRSIDVVINSVEQQDLIFALSNANQGIKDFFFNNMSQGMASILKDELEVLGSVEKVKISESKNKIVKVVTKLLDNSKISRLDDE